MERFKKGLEIMVDEALGAIYANRIKQLCYFFKTEING
jgi:hypothetical protein